jgi:glucose-6-phosphate 1-dehydrogenase
MKTKLVIFGITGDLSRRKLLPALQSIVEHKAMKDLSIVGVSRREVDVAMLVKEATDSDTLAGITRVFTMDLATPGDYVRLKDDLDVQTDEQVLIYLSVPPSAAADIVDFLGQAGLNLPNVKLLFEKPFGFDLESAKDYLTRTAEYFEESQIYRIDHYAAKDIAQQLIAMKTKEQWSNESIESVEVIASEKIGVEGRAVFYDETGALRDFIQGHLMQLLALVLKDTPADERDLPAFRLAALQQIRVASADEAIRAQYDSYAEEIGNPGSLTETFASLELHSNDPHWQDVTLRLTTGKALSEKLSAVIITYKDGHKDILDEAEITPDGRKLDAYERVLIEAFEGRHTIFTTGPEVIRAWEIVKPVQDTWDMDNAPLMIYASGTPASELV